VNKENNHQVVPHTRAVVQHLKVDTSHVTIPELVSSNSNTLTKKLPPFMLPDVPETTQHWKQKYVKATMELRVVQQKLDHMRAAQEQEQEEILNPLYTLADSILEQQADNQSLVNQLL
jgi:hypothetical protein